MSGSTSDKTLVAEMNPAQADKLYAHNRQQLSAMLDGELSPDQAKFMLRRLQHDSELAACWERWQVCGEILRGRSDVLLPADFSQRVARAIDDGQAMGRAQTGHAQARKPWRLVRWGGGAALAASVALVALFVSRQAPQVEPAAVAAPVQVASGAAGAPADAPLVATIETSEHEIAGHGTPERVQPAPATPTVPDHGAPLAAALAVAVVPKRLADRRNRAQAQRAAVRARREAQAPVMASVNAAPVAQPSIAAQGYRPALAASFAPADALAPTTANPFAAQPIVATKPWPRAILPSLRDNGALNASFGSTRSFHPFEPRLQSPPAATSADQEAGADAERNTGPR